MADPLPLNVVIEDDDNSVIHDPETGAIEIPQPGGGTIVQFNPGMQGGKEERKRDWFANLAEEMETMELAKIASELIDAIAADERSRAQHLQTIARGIDTLGLKLEEPKSGVDSMSVTGGGAISSVTNPLLLEAVLKGWANTAPRHFPNYSAGSEGPSAANDLLARDGRSWRAVK